MAARRIVATSAGGGRLVASLAQTGVGYTQCLHNKSPLKNSVHVHAVLGGDGPRWQPLNGSDRHALKARRQSESVLAGGNGNGGIQLRPDDDYSARPSAEERLAAGGGSGGADRFRRRRIPNLFIHIRPFLSRIGITNYSAFIVIICIETFALVILIDRNSRPVNSAYFYLKCLIVCRFNPLRCSRF